MKYITGIKHLADRLMQTATPVALSAVIALSSCGDFLDEYATDQRYCEKVQDIEDLMIGNAFMPYQLVNIYGIETMMTSNLEEGSGYHFPWLHVMDDDSEALLIGDDTQTDYNTQAVTKKGTPLNMLGNIHYWQPEAYTSVENKIYDDYQWKRVYARIGAINSIIYNSENEVTAKTEEEKTKLQHLEGEAYFLRAYYYFYLANIYGMPYSEATASQDFCVPLKVSENIQDKYFSRNSNAEVYAQILSDLKVAEDKLAGYSSNDPKRVGIGAVKALLSRVYLYMERYDDVVKECKAVASLGYSIPDFNTMDNINDSHATINSPEVIFTMGSNTTPTVFTPVQSSWGADASGNWVQKPNASCFRPSNDLMDSYEQSDLRRNFFFFNSEGYTQVRKMSGNFAAENNNFDMISDVFMLRYAEVILNEAEAEAMTGNTEEARKLVHSLRTKRIIGAEISSIPTDNASLVEFIRAERRRELCFEGGHRWFDLRRYAVNTKFPLSQSFTIRHNAYSYDPTSGSTICTGYYELPFMSSKDAWVLPAPNYAVEFNRGALTNVLRSERKFIKY